MPIRPQRIRHGDLASGLALAALGAFVVQQAWGWDYLGPDGPGAGFFPRWYGMAMIALSLMLIARSARGETNTSTATPGDSSIGRALACWAALVVCIAVSKTIGFFASFALLCWFVSALLFRQRQRIAIPFAIGSALALWLLFDYALGVDLPRGAWWS